MRGPVPPRVPGVLCLVISLGLLIPSAARADEAGDRVRAQVDFARARIASASKKWKRAVTLLDRALTADPSHTAARHLRGVCLYRLGLHKRAERDLMSISYRRPKDVALRRLLARVLQAQGKHMWAARQYQHLTQLTPRAGDVWLGYGYCLFKLGEATEARKALRRAAKLGPRPIANRARVLLAMLLQKTGKLRDARRLLGGIHGPGQRAANRLTTMIFAAEGRKGRGLTLSFRLGVGGDSNISMDPVDSRASGSAGLVTNLAASATWQAYTWGAHAVGVAGVVSRSFAINTWEDGTCVPDYSMIMAGISPYWSMRLSTGRYDHKLRLGYRGQVITLDGDCTEDARIYAFSESHGGTATWVTEWSDATSTHLMLDVGYTLFNQQVRDSLGTVFEVGQSIFLAKRRVKLYPELHLRYEHARGAWWSHVAVRPSLALSALVWKIDLIASVGLEYQVYPGSADPDNISIRPWLLPADKRRSDLIARLGISAGAALTKWLRFDVAYRYRRNKSNAAPYDYDRHTALLSFTASVELLRGEKKGGHK
jgi:Flp pilus assembly protein TadD